MTIVQQFVIGFFVAFGTYAIMMVLAMKYFDRIVKWLDK
jgi:hypothetical protein